MESETPVRGRAISLIEILVVVIIAAILTAILIPVIANVREQGRKTVCLSNMRQVGTALIEYAQDDAGYFPPASNWSSHLLTYAPANDVFRCPSAIIPDTWEQPILPLPFHPARGYAMNFALYRQNDSRFPTRISHPSLRESSVHFPSTTVALCEAAYQSGPDVGLTGLPSALSGPDDGTELFAHTHYIGTAGADRHSGGSDYAFVDGHVHWYTRTQVQRATQTNSSPHFRFVADPTKVNNGADPSFEL